MFKTSFNICLADSKQLENASLTNTNVDEVKFLVYFTLVKTQFEKKKKLI